jgi:hypothetical protein
MASVGLCQLIVKPLCELAKELFGEKLPRGGTLCKYVLTPPQLTSQPQLIRYPPGTTKKLHSLFLIIKQLILYILTR